MGSRRKSRLLALQALYLADICALSLDDATEIIGHSLREPEKILKFAKELSTGTTKNIDRINTLITQFTENWEMKRMAAIDRNILRLSSFELLYCRETPVSVIIDEAVEIAKEYSTPESGKFVNGILDRIKSRRRKLSNRKKDNG